MAATNKSDDFAWGDANSDGIALGLGVDRVTPAGCEYRVALVNRSSEPRAVVLFATLDNTYRTRIVARQGTNTVARPAVKPPAAVTRNVRLVIELAPGQVSVRPGATASFGLDGAASLHLVLGGIPTEPAELTSGALDVSLAS